MNDSLSWGKGALARMLFALPRRSSSVPSFSHSRTFLPLPSRKGDPTLGLQMPFPPSNLQEAA